MQLADVTRQNRKHFGNFNFKLGVVNLILACRFHFVIITPLTTRRPEVPVTTVSFVSATFSVLCFDCSQIKLLIYRWHFNKLPLTLGFLSCKERFVQFFRTTIRFRIYITDIKLLKLVPSLCFQYGSVELNKLKCDSVALFVLKICPLREKYSMLLTLDIFK